MKKKKKVWLIIGAVVIVAALIIGNMVSTGKDLTKVYADPVKTKNLTEEVSASGYIQPKTRVNITSQVTAEIIGIYVKDGQEVTKGQVLVQLDTVQLKKTLEQTEFSLNELKSRSEASKAMFLQAEEEYDRQKELFERDLTSETLYNNAHYTYLNYKYGYEAMLSQIKQARARYEQADDNLEKTTIIAPMEGVITYLDAEVGEIAAAQTPYSMGRTLMTISNLSAFEVEVDVDETEIIKIVLGQESKIEVDAFIDTVFKGEVVEIGNTAMVSTRNTNEQATNFKVKVLFLEDNPNIRPGMSATVDIITNSRDEVMVVPYGAVVMRSLDADSLEAAQNGEEADNSVAVAEEDKEDGEDEGEADSEETDSLKDDDKNMQEMKGVFVVREGKAAFCPVVTGIADQKDIEVISGINDDDSVISGPYRLLRKLKHDEEIEITEKPSTGNI